MDLFLFNDCIWDLVLRCFKDWMSLIPRSDFLIASVPQVFGDLPVDHPCFFPSGEQPEILKGFEPLGRVFDGKYIFGKGLLPGKN